MRDKSGLVVLCTPVKRIGERGSRLHAIDTADKDQIVLLYEEYTQITHESDWYTGELSSHNDLQRLY